MPCGRGHMVWHEWGFLATRLFCCMAVQGVEPLAKEYRNALQNYRLIVADIPGLGDSDDPPFKFDHKDYPTGVRKLAEIMSLGIETISLGICAFISADFRLVPS